MVGRGEEGGGSGGGGKGRGVGGKGTPRLIIELTPAACPPCLPPVLPIARCRSYDSSNHERFPVGDTSKRAFTYFVMTGGRFVGAAAVRLAVLKFLLSMTATKDVLAMANLEVDLKNIQEGNTVTVKWRGKPVFIRHRWGGRAWAGGGGGSVLPSFRSQLGWKGRRQGRATAAASDNRNGCRR